MAIISLRLNQNEEKMIDFLADYYEQDKSSLIKYSLNELYEDILDRQSIHEYEAKEKSGKIRFVASNEIMNTLKKKKSCT